MDKGIKLTDLTAVLKKALKEDMGSADITTKILFTDYVTCHSKIVAKEHGIIAGIPAAEKIFKMLDKNIYFRALVKDGGVVKRGQAVVQLKGNARKILSGERIALNLLSHLSGVATLTNKFVRIVKKYRVKIMDTRKTIPNLRSLQKYAVKTGGGYNHRMGLFDQILIKDNHVKMEKSKNRKIRLNEIIEKTRRGSVKDVKIEIEVGKISELKEALNGNPDIIMLDNMSLFQIKKSVKVRNEYFKNSGKKVLLEASGNVTLENVRKIAATGVDMISVGRLTHSAPALNMSLEVVKISDE